MGGGTTVAMALVDCVPVALFLVAAVILQRDLYDRLPKGAYSLVAAGSIMAFLGGLMKALWKILYATGICDYVLLDHALFTLQGPGFLLFFLGLTGLFWRGEKDAGSCPLPLRWPSRSCSAWATSAQSSTTRAPCTGSPSSPTRCRWPVFCGAPSCSTRRARRRPGR